MTITGGNTLGLATRGVHFSVSIPSTPTIVTIVDNVDQDSITVSVTGSGTIQLYYRVKYTTAWTAGQSRSGSGDIIQTGLTAGSWYEIYATATVEGNTSAPSTLSIIRLSDSDDTTIETALFAILHSDATIEGIVSDRIFPNIVQQGEAMPAITYQQISGPRDQTMDGPSGLVQTRFQINCLAEKYIDARTLAEAVRKELDGYHGTVNTVVIQIIMLADEADLPQVKPGTDRLKRYGKRLDFIIWFNEPTS